jgi:dGTPase
MDWSDDVTYAVHDVEDFYRAGRIPLHLLSSNEDDHERKAFYDEVFQRRKGQDGVWNRYSRAELETAFEGLVVLFEIDRPYAGTQEHRAKLRKFSGQCINMFVNAIQLRVPTKTNQCSVDIEPQFEKQVTMLKELTWHYVINAPSLATEQHGQRKVIRGLFECLLEAAEKMNFRVFPTFYQEKLASVSASEFPRLVIDLIAGMTERQCVDIFHTLTGVSVTPSFERVL